MKTKTLLTNFFVLMLVLMFAISACQPASTPTEEAPAPIVTEPPSTEPAVVADPQNAPMQISADIYLDPALAQDEDSLMVAQYLYEGLVRLDENGTPQPALAESWVISDDQLDYIFTLRSTALFSDGTQITPDIVADNFNRWFDPQSPLRGTGEYAAWERIFLGFHGEKGPDDRAKSSVDGIQKVDVNTVLIHLNRPVPELLVYLADPAFAILSPAALADANYGKRDSAMISSGPYIISSWTDTGLVLGPNPVYWGGVPTKELNFIYK